MKVIYVAGPYRAKTEYQVQENIRQAESCALDIWDAGAAAICPHKNTSGFGGYHNLPDDIWLNGDLEIIKRCDALVVLPNYEKSEGTLQEIKLAESINLPVFYYNYLDSFERQGQGWCDFFNWIKTGKYEKILIPPTPPVSPILLTYEQFTTQFASLMNKSGTGKVKTDVKGNVVYTTSPPTPVGPQSSFDLMTSSGKVNTESDF